MKLRKKGTYTSTLIAILLLYTLYEYYTPYQHHIKYHFPISSSSSSSSSLSSSLSSSISSSAGSSIIKSSSIGSIPLDPVEEEQLHSRLKHYDDLCSFDSGFKKEYKERYDQLQKDDHRYYIAMALSSNDALMLSQVLNLIDFLGPEKVYLSLHAASAQATFQTKLSSLSKSKDGFQYTIHAGPLVSATSFASQSPFVLNELLMPLRKLYEKHTASKDDSKSSKDALFGTVVVLEDAYWCLGDALELIYQSRFQDASVVTSMDVIQTHDIQLHLNRAHDINGKSLRMETPNKIFSDEQSNKNFYQLLPIRLISSWGRITVLDPYPFYNYDKVSFSTVNFVGCPIDAEIDFVLKYWAYRRGKVLMVPRVRTVRSWESFEILHAGNKEVDGIDVGYGLPFKTQEKEKIDFSRDDPLAFQCRVGMRDIIGGPTDMKRDNQFDGYTWIDMPKVAEVIVHAVNTDRSLQ